MLTIRRKRGSVAALAVLLLAPVVLTGGTAMVPVQAQTLDGGATTLTPGEGASPQEELLAEALGAMVRAGFNPADFDMEKAIFDPQGRAVFLPVRVTDEVREQVRAFTQNEQRSLLMGVLYTREPFEFQGKRYGRGLHPVVIINQDANRWHLPGIDRPRLLDSNNWEGGSCNNNSNNGDVICITNVFVGGPAPHPGIAGPPPQPGGGLGELLPGACAALGSAARFAPTTGTFLLVAGLVAGVCIVIPLIF